MNLALVFRISGVLLILNGISMFFTPGMAVGMYGWEERFTNCHDARTGNVISCNRCIGVDAAYLDREQTGCCWHVVGCHQSRLGCPHWI